jgi:hypothetical protein
MRGLTAGAMVPLALALVLTLSTADLALAAGIRSASGYNLSTGPAFRVTGDTIHRNASYTFTLVNGSSREVLVRNIGQVGPGLRLLVPSGGEKNRTVLPHKSISVTIEYHVSDCATVPTGSWPLTIDAAWKAGKWQRVSLQLLNAGSMQWQKFIAHAACL